MGLFAGVLLALALFFSGIIGGLRVLKFFRLDGIYPRERICLAFGLGYAMISYFVLLAGACGLLYRQSIYIIIAIFILAGINELKPCLRQIFSLFTAKLSMPGAFLILALALMLIPAVTPSFSNDAMVYHLVDAKYFAASHHVGLIPQNSTNSLWPYLVQMYFSIAMLFGAYPLAGIFHWVFVPFTILAMYSFERRFLGNVRLSVSGLIFALTPVVLTLCAQTYVDLGVVFYAFLSIYTLLIWDETRKNRWLALSGIFCGLALSVKYSGLLIFLIAGVYLLFRGKKPKIQPQYCLLFTVFCLISCCVWYLRQYLQTGNPVFPFLSGIFPGKLRPEVMAALSEKGIRSAYGMGKGIVGMLQLPWNLTMKAGSFGGEQLGPLFLAVLPGIFLLKSIPRAIRLTLIFSLAYLLLWYMLYQNMRFLVPIVPFLSIACAYIIKEAFPKGARRAAMIILGIYLAASAGNFLYKHRTAFMQASGIMSTAQYLSLNERSYKISEYVNKNLPKGAYLLVVNEEHTFFIDLPYERELYWWIYDNYDSRVATPSAVAALLRSRGITHILYSYKPGKMSQADKRLRGLVSGELYDPQYLQFVYGSVPQSLNAQGTRYIIYELKA